MEKQGTKNSLQTAIHIVSIGILSTGVYILFNKDLLFSSLITLIILLATGISLYSMQRKQVRKTEELTEELKTVQTNLRERMLAEEIKHQYYENLLNKVDTAVLVADSKGDIEWMNQAAILLLGHQPRLPHLFTEPSVKATQTVRFEKHGNIVELAVSSTNFSARGKERLLISLKDIHSVLERNEMEAWQKLISVLTHEIMNSITPILSLSETLSERQMPEVYDKNEYEVMLQAMQVIHRRSKGLLGFVENYRKLTWLPAPNLSKVSVNELLSDLKKLFPEDGIRIEKPETDVVLSADRFQLEQVLINLLKNAVEACSKQKNLHIEVNVSEDREENKISISIQDNGEGILPEVVDKIFVPFFTTKSSGSGIGLSLCKQIITQHGGRIGVSSRVGIGSCFTVVLPTSMRYYK